MRTKAWPLARWLALLETLSPQEIVLGLERVETMLQRLQLRMPETVFHVAGTNGKGSSVAMLEALLRTTGKRVGCYTSPHLRRYNERIRVDGLDASDAEITAAFADIEALRDGLPLTYFEFGTLAALLVFAQSQVEIAVLEIGMGGRLDAVNAVQPTASLITNIALDHCAWLGATVEAIAAEKAGIMRAGKPIVFGATELPQAILATASSLGAVLLAAQRDYSWSVHGSSWSWRGIKCELRDLDWPSLPGLMQIQNAAGVLAVLEAAGFDGLLDAANVKQAFSGLRVPGRMQEIGTRWILDVAHNPAAATALAATLEARAHCGRTIVIIGMLDDKDVAGFVAPLAAIADQWIAVTALSSRAIPAKELARRVANATDKACLVATGLGAALERATQLAGDGDRILVTGSFYVVGAALEALRASA
ncbi:MAG: bifunctional folylpolyglutamate synthase/dihydrofolate synthase [Gammaproteobacteria bacterium]|nr:bifunctional folylpolyglutamate synthase/dihydrofolate synthase [Gammaproteobacteria bacterium]